MILNSIKSIMITLNIIKKYYNYIKHYFKNSIMILNSIKVL